jgi:hypothetical protein
VSMVSTWMGACYRLQTEHEACEKPIYQFWHVNGAIHKGPAYSGCPIVIIVCQQNFNLGYKFGLVGVRAFIFHMCIPCGKTVHLIPRL